MTFPSSVRPESEGTNRTEDVSKLAIARPPSAEISGDRCATCGGAELRAERGCVLPAVPVCAPELPTNAALRESVRRVTRDVVEGMAPPGCVRDVIEAGDDRMETCMTVLDHAEAMVVVVVVVFTSAEQRFPGRGVLHDRFGLTERESEVARLLASRKTNKEIARLLSITPHTSWRHTEHVLQKLGISSRRDVRSVLHGVAADPDSQA